MDNFHIFILVWTVGSILNTFLYHRLVGLEGSIQEWFTLYSIWPISLMVLVAIMLNNCASAIYNKMMEAFNNG